MNLPNLCRYYLCCLCVANQDGVVVAAFRHDICS